MPDIDWKSDRLLALLYAQEGDLDEAQMYIQKAKISLEILYGLARCDLDYKYNQDIRLEDLYSQGKIGILRGQEFIKSPVAKGVFFRACQENMVISYPQNYDLNQLLDDPLIKMYLKARAVIINLERE